MKIYLADLFHTYNKTLNPDTYPYTMPLGIGYIASTISKYHSKAEVRLFRDPNRLLEAMRVAEAELLGFTLTSWNMDLSQRMIARLKTDYPKVRIVVGGPCIDDTDEQIITLLQTIPQIDFAIPGEGEKGILELLKAIEENSLSTTIPGVAYLSKEHSKTLATEPKLIRGRYQKPMVNAENVSVDVSPELKIPSPYLDGTLDAFLEEGLVPVIQTMRGCPYQCEFCVSGTLNWNKIRGFEVQRVVAEIDYALSRSTGKDLILTDENWGILGDRDVEIARAIVHRYKKRGSPKRLYYYTAKMVNEASHTIAEMVAPIAWIGELTMSFQSLNPETRKIIKRTNISMENLALNIEWARTRNIMTSSDMIYGFPYETVDTFLGGIETLLRYGVDSIEIHPLQLFPGIELTSKKSRELFGIKTRFRLQDGCYGTYDSKNVVAAEAEEVVVGTKWLSFEDYLRIRLYAFFYFILFGRGILSEFFELCKEARCDYSGIVRRLTFTDYSQLENLNEILTNYLKEARDELKLSREEVHQEVKSKLKQEGDSVGGVKLNLIYLGMIMSRPKALSEFTNLLSTLFGKKLAAHPEKETLLSYLNDILPNQVPLLSDQTNELIPFDSRFDYSRWKKKEYRHLSELRFAVPERMESQLDSLLKANLRNFSPQNREDLQYIFSKIPRRHFQRKII